MHCLFSQQDGRLLRLEPAASGGLFQLCNGTYDSFDAAFNFATRYNKKCNIAARELFERSPESTQFFNIYIPYEIQVGTVAESRLFAIPMLILNKPNNQVRYLSASLVPAPIPGVNTYNIIRP